MTTLTTLTTLATLATLAALADVATAAASTGPAPAAAGQAPACRAESGGRAPRVVELYTSEGCSSCPPADRWLSTLRGRDDVLALGFHVTYWDRLGWPDRFASAEATARQHERARALGIGYVYTPQVIVDGADWRGWPPLPGRAAAPAGTAPRLALERSGDLVVAEIRLAQEPTGRASGGRLAGYWAVLEDRHESRVRAGENAGETLRHDHVVRLYRPVPAWDGGAPQRLVLEVGRGVPEHPRRVAFVVTDAATQRPVQALALGC